MYIRLDTGDGTHIQGFEIEDSEGDLLRIKEEDACCRIFWERHEDEGLMLVRGDLDKLIKLCETMKEHLASTD